MAFDPDAYTATPFDPDAYVGAKKPYNSPLDSVGRGMTMAPASAFLDAITGQGEGDFSQRFKSAKAYYDAKNQQAQKDNPNAYAGGELLTNAMAMAATAPIAGAVAPLSRLASSAPQALRMAAGVGDAMVGNALLSQARTAGQDNQSRGVAMQEALYSPYNLLGSVGPAVESLPMAAQHWRDVANRARTRVMAPDSPQAQRVFRETFGSQEAAGEATRNVGGKDVARRMDAPERARELNFVRDQASAGKGALTDELAGRGVVIDPEAVAADITGVRDRRFGDPDTRTHTHPETSVPATGLGEAAVASDRSLGGFLRRLTGYRPTSVNVEYPPPPQGRLGLPTNELVPGPEATFPAPRQIGTGVGYQDGLPLTRTSLQAGPEVVTSRPRAQPGSQLDMMHQRDPNVPARALRPDEPVGQTVGVQRDMFGTPSGSAVEGAPLMTQDPGIAQSVAGQGRMNAPSFPERGPVVPASTNVEHGPLNIAQSERIKTAIDQGVHGRVARGYPTSTPKEAIALDPELMFQKAQADVLRAAGERAVASQAPDDFAEFMRLKNTQRKAETFRGPAELESDVAAAGGGGGRSSHLYPSKHGAAYWALENYIKAPLRHGKIDVAQAMSDFMKNGATQQQASALAAALADQTLRKKENR